jgi:hypothetical protein
MKHRKDWTDLLWVLAENDVQKYNELRKLEIVQFYDFLERWKEAMKKKTERINQQNRKK